MTDAPAIHVALAAVMDDVKAVAKRDRNEHHNFLFRGIDAVVNAVAPSLRKHKVVVVPRIQSVVYDLVQTSTGKPATACRIVADYVFYGPAGDSLTTSVIGEAWDNGDKAAPKAMSVAFRTALLQALALPTDDADPDSHTYEQAPRAENAEPAATTRMGRGKPEPITPQQIKKIAVSMNDLGMTDRTKALEYVSDVIGRPVESRNDLSKAEAHRLIEALEGVPFGMVEPPLEVS